MIIILLIWLSYAIIAVFATVCLATGLYYIAEFVEEHTVITRRVIKYSIGLILFIYILLLIFESLPFTALLVGIAAHILFYSLLKDFPFIELTNMKFIASSALSVINHLLWFWHFTKNYSPFNEIVSFFLICVWLIPFCFFVSLSANDNALPTINTPLSWNNAAKQDASWRDSGIGDMDGFANKPRHVRNMNRLLSFFNFLRKKRSEVLPSSVFNVKAI